MDDEIRKIVSFLEECGKLKDTLRNSWTSGGRHESVPEHTWRMAMFAACLKGHFKGLDFEKVYRIILVHDLGEIYLGDVPAIAPGRKDKGSERSSVQKALSSLPERVSRELFSAWEEYSAGSSGEARLVKAIDKLETIMQHNQAQSPEKRPIDYPYNLRYGKEYTDYDEVAKSIREILDDGTRKIIGNP